MEIFSEKVSVKASTPRKQWRIMEPEERRHRLRNRVQ
jgi:hypothetical protein